MDIRPARPDEYDAIGDITVDERDEVLGAVTYVPGPDTSMSEFTDRDVWFSDAPCSAEEPLHLIAYVLTL